MNLEKLINLVLSDSDITIEYSNVNGQEKLIVNGEQVKGLSTEPEFDDSEILEKVANHKEAIDSICDCIFQEGLEVIEESYDIVTMSNLMDQEHFTEDEAEVLDEFIDFANAVYQTVIANRIKNLEKMYNKF